MPLRDCYNVTQFDNLQEYQQHIMNLIETSELINVAFLGTKEKFIGTGFGQFCDGSKVDYLYKKEVIDNYKNFIILKTIYADYRDDDPSWSRYYYKNKEKISNRSKLRRDGESPEKREERLGSVRRRYHSMFENVSEERKKELKKMHSEQMREYYKKRKMKGIENR